MSDLFTDDDVTAALDAYDRTSSSDTADQRVRAVLAVVAPQIAARALRQAADEVKWSGIGGNSDQYLTMRWLRARADAIEGES